MSNKELYKKTFSQLHSSENKVMEVIQMKDKIKKKHSVSKKLIIIAACIGALLSAGVVANAATDGELAKSIMVHFTDANGNKSELKPVSEGVDDEGNKVSIYKPDENTEIEIPKDGYDGQYKYEINNAGPNTFSVEIDDDDIQN